MKTRLLVLILMALTVVQTRLAAQVPPPPTITQQPGSVGARPGAIAVFTVTASGPGPFAYQWQFNGSNLPNNVITTVAGGGIGDGDYATNAVLATAPYRPPRGLAMDAAGNLFIADALNNRVRKVDLNSIITTVAGTGYAAYSGDGGVAISACLNNPLSVAVNGSGDLFIADSNNSRVRRVDTNGIITTVAGTVTNGYFGDGGPATNAGLSGPFGVAVDSSGNLFIADYGNHVVRKVDSSGTITTVAGNNASAYSGDGGAATNASLSNPGAVTADAFGDLFIADFGDNHVRKVDANGIITTFAGNGSKSYPYNSAQGVPATGVAMNPMGVSVDRSGNLFICDNWGWVVFKVDTNDIITTRARISYPIGVVVDACSNLFVSEDGDERVFELAANGSITAVAGLLIVPGVPSPILGDGGLATNGGMNFPWGTAVDASENLFFADARNYRIRKVGSNGIITTVAAASYEDNLFGVATDASGNVFYTDSGNNLVKRIDSNGVIVTMAGTGAAAYSGDRGPATNASLNDPVSVAVDSFGNLFIGDAYNHRVRKVDAKGIITTVAGNGTQGYFGDDGLATRASLSSPWGMAVDSAGNLFIADNNNNVIREVHTNGIITTVAGNGKQSYSGDGGRATRASLWLPYDVKVDSSGSIFIADSGNNRIRKVAASGIITTVAGNGTQGYSGDGGPATNAVLFSPSGVAVDAGGNILISDTGNSFIRKVGNSQGPILVLNNVSSGNVGNYQVVVSGAGGSVTSSVATLTIVAAPFVSATRLNPNGTVTVSLVSNPDSANVVLAATNLATPVQWQPISASLSSPDGTLQFTDTNAPGYATRFYEVRSRQ